MKETKEQLAVWYYKKHVEGIPLTQDEVIQSYLAGFDWAQKEFKKKLIDRLNHYKSNLQEETKVKLNRLANKEKIRELEIKIELLKDLMKQYEKAQS